MRNGTRLKILAMAGAASLAACATHAGESGIAVTGGERTEARYSCDDGTDRTVTYVNGETDMFAIVPVEGKERIFVNVISGSGARYASGQYVWWTKGPDAWLYDEMRGEDGKPVATCREAG